MSEETIEWIFIVEDVPPYLYELNNILAVPQGFQNRIRYQKKWFPDRDEPEVGQRGIITLRVTPRNNIDDFEIGGPDERTYPIRCVEINNVREVGDVIYLEFINKELPGIYGEATGSDGLVMDEEFRTFREEMAECHDFDAKNDDDETVELENMVIQATDLDYSTLNCSAVSDDELGAWGDITEVLGKRVERFNDFDFVRISDFSRANEGSENQAKILRVEDESRYKVTNDQTYEISLIQRTYTMHHDEREHNYSVLVPRNIRIESGPEIDTIISNRSVGSKYDILKFKIRPRISGWRKRTFFRVVFDKEPPTDFLEVENSENPPEIILNAYLDEGDHGLVGTETIEAENPTATNDENSTPRPDLVPKIEVPIEIGMKRRQKAIMLFIGLMYPLGAAVLLLPNVNQTDKNIATVILVGVVIISYQLPKLKGFREWAVTFLTGR